jgi:hypothetical protein
VTAILIIHLCPLFRWWGFLYTSTQRHYRRLILLLILLLYYYATGCKHPRLCLLA